MKNSKKTLLLLVLSISMISLLSAQGWERFYIANNGSGEGIIETSDNGFLVVSYVR